MADPAVAVEEAPADAPQSDQPVPPDAAVEGLTEPAPDASVEPTVDPDTEPDTAATQNAPEPEPAPAKSDPNDQAVGDVLVEARPGTAPEQLEVKAPDDSKRPSTAPQANPGVTLDVPPPDIAQADLRTPAERLKELRSELAPHQIGEFKQMFEAFDRDGDGTITLKELAIAHQQMGQNPTDAELLEMIKEVDTDGSGEVDWVEFLTLMARSLQSEKETDEEIRQAFRTFDTDDGGSVEASEVHEVMKRFGENCTVAEVQEILNEICSDGSGTLKFADFWTFYRQPPRRISTAEANLSVQL